MHQHSDVATCHLLCPPSDLPGPLAANLYSSRQAQNLGWTLEALLLSDRRSNPTSSLVQSEGVINIAPLPFLC